MNVRQHFTVITAGDVTTPFLTEPEAVDLAASRTVLRLNGEDVLARYRDEPLADFGRDFDCCTAPVRIQA